MLIGRQSAPALCACNWLADITRRVEGLQRSTTSSPIPSCVKGGGGGADGAARVKDE